MLIHNFLENSATRHPEKTAVIHGDARATYKELNHLSNSLANYLMDNGIAKGDRVALLLENGLDYITAYYAVLKAGAVAAPLNPGLKPDGLEFLLQNLEPAAIITSFKSERILKNVPLSGLSTLKLLIIKAPKQKWNTQPCKVSTLEETRSNPTNPTSLPNATNPEDLAGIIYTSGTTGGPKGVMLSHKNIVSNTNSICQYLSITQKDIQMVVVPFFYVMGKSLLNTHIAAGGTLVINNRFLYLADVVKQMISEKVTSFSGVPSTYAYLLNRSPLEKYRDQLGHLRYCSQAGGHMAKSTKLALRMALPDHTQIVIMYGATEASARLTYLDPTHFESKIESIGKPIPGVSIRIIDRTGYEVPDGREGELVAAGPNIMHGYWKHPGDTARILSDLGYHTGDIGHRDAEGFLYVNRRKDGLLKISGHRVNPIEIVDFLMATDQLIEAAVVGLPDPLMGTKAIALTVPKEETVNPKEIMEQCAANLPNHKCPTQVIMTRALPKNANGKIDLPKCLELVERIINKG